MKFSRISSRERERERGNWRLPTTTTSSRGWEHPGQRWMGLYRKPGFFFLLRDPPANGSHLSDRVDLGSWARGKSRAREISNFWSFHARDLIPSSFSLVKFWKNFGKVSFFPPPFYYFYYYSFSCSERIQSFEMILQQEMIVYVYFSVFFSYITPTYPSFQGWKNCNSSSNRPKDNSLF